MLDPIIWQDLGKYIFQIKNIFLALIPIFGYAFMQNNFSLYKYTLLGFLYGFVIIPLAGGIFSFFNNYEIVSFFYFILCLCLCCNKKIS